MNLSFQKRYFVKKIRGSKLRVTLPTYVFNTLAENGTTKPRQNNILVNGKGSDLSKIDALKGRAKRKTITQSMMVKLIDVAKENGEPKLENAYLNTYKCQQEIITSDGRFYGNYCKNRFCTLCCSIRKAEVINKYYPILKNWEDPHFVTITVKACKAEQLERYFKSIKHTFKKIVEKYKKQSQRGTGIKLIGIKSLECNFNPIKKTYNPHFHIIVATEEMAKIIINEWHSRSKKGFVNLKGQNIQRIWNLESKLIETIKYGSKIFTEPDLKKRAKQTDTAQIYIKALDTILMAMKGKRIFDRFGFNLPKSAKKVRPDAKLLSDFQEWEYNSKTADWINNTTGEVLTGYNVPSRLQAILYNNLNGSIS